MSNEELDKLRAAWSAYESYLRKKYALEGDFRFRCPHHQVIHDLLFARVPILPEEAVYSNPEIHCAMNTPLSVHTIRRKLEAGGYAEPEQAVYLDGRYYSTEWIKSGVGVFPQQCTIEKEPHGCATNNT
jgi:hypothetical protein